MPGADKQSVPVNISSKEGNRLAVEGRKLDTVVPMQPGILTIQKDDAVGAVFITVKNPEQSGAAVSVFATDDQGVTYKMVMMPRPITAEEIILQPPAGEKGAAIKRAATSEGRAGSYQRRVKDLILAMADEELSDQAMLDKVDVNKEVPLWKEGKLVLVSKYLDIDIVGEKYRLTNVSRADMLLVEQELFRRGVRAVSIKSMTLAPSDSTDIFIVRERKENE